LSRRRKRSMLSTRRDPVVRTGTQCGVVVFKLIFNEQVIFARVYVS
jgi:hypothetical protein